MSKFFVFALTISMFTRSFSQDCNKKMIRIYGGPEFNFLMSSLDFETRGLKIGFSAGAEANLYFKCNTAFVTGIGYSYTPFDYWLSSADSFQYSTNHSKMLTIPIGLKIKTKDNLKLSSYYFQIAYTNNIIFESNHQDYSLYKYPSEFQTAYRKGTYIAYNPGATLEFGVENRFNQKNIISTSIIFRAVYHNKFSGVSKDQMLVGGVGLRMGYFFK